VKRVEMCESCFQGEPQCQCDGGPWKRCAPCRGSGLTSSWEDCRDCEGDGMLASQPLADAALRHGRPDPDCASTHQGLDHDGRG
jgi:hypothetical protein